MGRWKIVELWHKDYVQDIHILVRLKMKYLFVSWRSTSRILRKGVKRTPFSMGGMIEDGVEANWDLAIFGDDQDLGPGSLGGVVSNCTVGGECTPVAL